MTLAPFLLAGFFGLLISALLYFVLVWPAREPDDDQPAHDPPTPQAVLDQPAGKPAHSPGDAAASGNEL